MAGRSYWIETLGCPKNQVDSDKLVGTLTAEGLTPAASVDSADLVVVNTCAFIEAAREESIETILELSDLRMAGAELVVTGCLAERYGDELAASLPEVDRIAPFGVSLLGSRTSGSVPVSLRRRSSFDLLELPRPASGAPWAYVKVAEGCDRACGFCAIPSFRGAQRSRSLESILAEVDSLGAAEVVLVAQDLASWGRDSTGGRDRSAPGIVDLVGVVAAVVPRVRLLYLYPSALNDTLVQAILATGIAYFDLSLQHSSGALLRRMRRWGDGTRFLERIASIRAVAPDAALRSSFIVGYPGETEEDHDQLISFLEEAQLDWAGFFAYSAEEGTFAAGLDDRPDELIVAERLAEVRAMQEEITASRRELLVGSSISVLVDAPGIGRSHREAPEIDGIVEVPLELEVGSVAQVLVSEARGPDLIAQRIPVMG